MQRPARALSSDVWSLSDGHAGNVRQAQALAAALGLPARDITLHPHAPWRWLAPRRLPGAARAFGDGFRHELLHPPRLAIGCGRQAALATRLLRTRSAAADGRVRTVQILDPRLDPRHWDLVVVPEHDRLRGDNVITLLGSLHPVDDLWLAAARRQFATMAAWPQPRTVLLMGGSSAHGELDAAQAQRLFDALAAQVREEGGSLLATASRRTPPALRAGMRERFGALPGLVWCDDRDGPNPYAGLLAWADRIVCTADSVNMLSEACATTVPVFVAGREQISGRPRRFVESLLERGRLRAWTDGLDAGGHCAPLRETARVAEAVRQRLQL